MSDSNMLEKCQRYGYVEDVEYESDYKNLDHRDTTVKLWESLHQNLKSDINIDQYEQNQVNVAMCASIIQLANNMNQQFSRISEKLDDISERIDDIEQSTSQV